MAIGMVLALQAVIFAVWAVIAFRSLFRLRAHVVRQTGQAMPGLAAALGGFRAFVTDPAFRGDRRALGAATAALAAVMALFAAITG